MESKNISLQKFTHNPHRLGFEAELRVQKDLEKRGYRVLHHRYKTPFAELDLILESPQGGLGIVEVKSLSQWGWIESRLPKKQVTRLQRATLFISENYDQPTSLCVAYVVSDKIFYLPIES